jgi:hypothetical protein
MQAKLIKSDDYYVLSIIEQKEFERIFATTNSVLEDKKHKLSKKNCDEIFGVINIEDLVDQDVDELRKILGNFHLFKYDSHQRYFKRGFNKAMELNKDKLFTIEDMKKCFKAARKEDSYCNLGGWQSELRYSNFKSYAKTIQQPTEIKVEIEMTCDGVQTGLCMPEICDCNIIPRLDEERCLILKRL